MNLDGVLSRALLSVSNIDASATWHVYIVLT